MFQPAEHTIAEVHAYLDTVDVLELGRVLAAERTGLARPEILSVFAPSLGGRTLPEEGSNG